MLNSKDKIVQIFKAHYSGLGIQIELYNKKLIIRDSLISFNIVVHTIIALLVIKLTSAMQPGLYLLPLVLLYAIIGYVIFWVDFKSINVIEFDLQNRNVSVTSRSFLRRLIEKYVHPQPLKYFYAEIAGVGVTNNERKTMLQVKHLVNMNMKNGDSIPLISFYDKLNSMMFSEFITAVID